MLIVGIVQGVRAVQALSLLNGIPFVGEVTSSYSGTVFWAASGGFIVMSIVLFIIGGVGLYAGSVTPKELPPQLNQISESPAVYRESMPPSVSTQYSQPTQPSQPLPRVGVCPSCGRTVVYISEHQRWYCDNEKKYI